MKTQVYGVIAGLLLFLGGCANLPEWVNAPAFSLSISLHDEEGKGYLDADGVCHIYMPFTKRAVDKGVDDQLEVCRVARQGKGFTEKKDGVRRFNFYPLRSVQQVAQHHFDVTKTKFASHQVICTTECGRLGALFEGDGYCGVIYIPTYTDRQGKEDRGTSAHELLHAFVGQFHSTGSRYWEWLPKSEWKGSSKKCN